jgi:NADH dehydrogenase FAD-containing subunit
MNVKVIKGVKILSSSPTTDGRTEVSLSNDEKKVVDLELPTIGVILNSECVSKTFLDGKGHVVVDEFLRVKDTQDVWAAGDVTNLDFAQFVYAEKQANSVPKNLDAVLKGEEPLTYKADDGRVMFFSLGRSKATGRVGDWKVPSIVIWWFSKFILLSRSRLGSVLDMQ